MSASIADRVDTRTLPDEIRASDKNHALRTDAVVAAPVATPPAFNTIPEPPGPIEKALLLTGWFLVERFVAVVLFFKKGEFH
jgi:hypothetical protein